MGLKFIDFLTKEFEEAIKKVCDFEHTIADKLKLARIKQKISTEKEIFSNLSKELAEKYKLDFEEAISNEDKQKVNQEYAKKQLELEKSISDLDLRLDYDLVSKTAINANDLHALLPAIEKLPEEKEEVKKEAKAA